MPDDPARVYWDSNVPISYLNEMADRLAVIEELLRKARAREIELVTSSLSIVEVAFAQTEKQGRALDPAVEESIDALWEPGGPIKTVEFYDLIARGARSLIRRGIDQGWGNLKPIDAIHLATAKQMGVAAFHTYCASLHAWDGHLGFPVTEPQLAQTILATGT
jgi:predicted nucleic acid-binding protein